MVSIGASGLHMAQMSIDRPDDLGVTITSRSSAPAGISTETLSSTQNVNFQMVRVMVAPAAHDQR
jgi:hypothetical protein